MKKFIKHLNNNIIGKVKGYYKTRGLKDKLTNLSWFCFNIIVTGIIITIIIELWSNIKFRFISFGLLSAIIMYYLKWLKKLIISRTNNEIDKL